MKRRYEVLVTVVRPETSAACVAVCADSEEEAVQIAREALIARLAAGNDDCLPPYYVADWEPGGPETVEVEEGEIVEIGQYGVDLELDEPEPEAGPFLPGL